MRGLLKSRDFVELREEDEWTDVSSLKHFFVVRNDRSIVIIKKHDTKSALIVATHNDAPCLKLKPNTKLSRFGCDQVRSAPYGNVTSSLWIDRNFLYTGQVVTRKIDNSGLVRKTVLSAESTVIIPSLAKHLGGKTIAINAELNMQPIDSLREKGKSDDLQSKQLIKDLISLSCIQKDIDQYQKDHPESKVDQPEEYLVDFDISLIPDEQTRKIGTSKDMLSGYALDVLACAISSLNGFLNSQDPQTGMNVLAIFDNYQIGGNTRIGAKSNLLESVFERIGCDDVTWANSSMINVENFKAFNPNDPKPSDQSDPVNLGDGLFVRAEMARVACANLNFKARLMMLAQQSGLSMTQYNVRTTNLCSIAQDTEIQVNVSTAIVGIGVMGLYSPRELIFQDDIACLFKFISQYFDCFRNIPEVEDI